MRKPIRRTAAREGHRVVSADPGQDCEGEEANQEEGCQGRGVGSCQLSRRGVEKEKSREGRDWRSFLVSWLWGSGGTLGL